MTTLPPTPSAPVGWTKVSDGLPEYGRRVLISWEHGICIAMRREAIPPDDEFGWDGLPERWHDDGEGFTVHPTHWAPLPPPPTDSPEDGK